jgi:uncharacterized membrane protein (UPF0182 family)
MSETIETTPDQTVTPIVQHNHLPPGPPAVPGAGPRIGLKKLPAWAYVSFLILVALLAVPALLQDWLWMRELDYAGIFWTLLSVKWGLAFVAFIGAFAFLWLNFRHASRNVFSLAAQAAATRAGSRKPTRVIQIQGVATPLHVVMRTIALCSAVVAAFFALGFYTQWDTYLRFRYASSFGISDPIFGIDVGFYTFRLPFYRLLQFTLVWLTVLAILGVSSQFAFFEIMRRGGGRKIDSPGTAAAHLSVLFFTLSAAFGWGFYLDRYDLLYSTRGVVYGVGYTADHVTTISLWVMIGASLAGCLLLALNLSRPSALGFFCQRWKALAVAAAFYVVLYLTGIVLVPALVQKFVVQPNELTLETPYLANYIEFTRKAYNLDAIRETSYPAMEDLTAAATGRNQGTIQNIRLWDSRPLLQTYQQTQAIRLYYDFYHVDTDRYHLPDGYHQVMLATRELSATLPAQARTWVNQNLEFTHGEGVVMNYVSKITPGGFPEFLIQNVPPEASQGLRITQPAIYYGEAMPGSKIVATNVKEFDYPKGNQNAYASYDGKGGIPLDSFGKRLLFAWTQADINILFTSSLNADSRIQIRRNVRDRVSQIAPFLKLDNDPYAVVSEGKLYWIQDAYTLSNAYPYSSPDGTSLGAGLNYIRNSVKAVVDMYDGTVSFYVMDPADPVLQVYRRAFPGVFKDLDQLSADLKLHLRYPRDLFGLQSTQYLSFHMTDPQVFYNREDLWVPPQEKYGGKVAPMAPYYILMKLPGSDQLEYLLMSPFTPQHRDNMISWLAARCDFPSYGKMLVYQLPKEKLVYGPNQVSAMIDQNTTISQQLTLWDQKGSGVIRGKLVVIPIENAFLYVVPLYLKAEGANFPQLKRVIAATGNKVVMERTLDEALVSLFASTPAHLARNKTPLDKPSLNLARVQLADLQKALDSLKALLLEPSTPRK